MKQRKRKAGGKPKRAKRASASMLRKGGTHLRVRNSGLEVWLYDDANLGMIRDTAGATGRRQVSGPARTVSIDAGFGGMPANLPDLTRQGIVLGYSLSQDDDLEIAVHVGHPLSDAEMSVARWLEPQTAFLRLPSGRLCVESNDASRIGPEQPAETGGQVTVPPGDYRVTLYRIDHETLDRERLTWGGPEQVIVLTPGGTTADAADFLLPYEDRRDLGWVGKYTVHGNRADGLAWFDSAWETFALNLDSPAAAKLSLVPGSYIRTHVPTVGITLISAFARSWDDALRLPPPAGVELEEYGYAALQTMGEWNGAEALFCRREATKTCVEDQHHNVWIPAVIEVLDVRPQELPGRAFAPIDLQAKQYFNPGFLTMVLSEVIPETADLDELPLPKALGMLDKKLAKLGLAPQGDVSWQERIRVRSVETSCRLYAGLPDGFAAILAGDGSFELMFVSELDDGTWVVTGLADEIVRRITTRDSRGLPVPHPRVRFQTMDESLATIFAAHKAALRQSQGQPVPAPTNMEEAVAALDRFLTVAFG